MSEAPRGLDYQWDLDSEPINPGPIDPWPDGCHNPDCVCNAPISSIEHEDN